MDKTNVNYSNITEEQLDKYWEYMLKENMLKENTKETTIRLSLELLLILTFIYGIGYAGSYIWPYFKDWHKGNVYTCALVIVFLIIMGWLLYTGMIDLQFMRAILTYDVRLRYVYAKKDLDWAYKLYRLQRLLKEENISKITNRGSCTLVVEYIEENGIFKEQEVQLESYYDRVVKEDSLDFSWMDEEINKVLAKNKLPEIV